MFLLKTCVGLVLLATISCDEGENIALGKHVFQSSTYGSDNAAGNAIDGDLATSSKTEVQRQPYLVIDLAEEYHVSSLAITNCDDAPLKDILIKLGDKCDSSSPVKKEDFRLVTRVNEIGLGETKSLDVKEENVRRRAGRCLLILARGKSSLCLAEVKANGKKTSNLALLRPAYQSSTIGKIDDITGVRKGVAGNTVDGKPMIIFRLGSCSHTKDEINPWWVVDLGELVRIYSILIKNRGDDNCVNCENRLGDFTIRLGTAFDRTPIGDGFDRLTYDFKDYKEIASVDDTFAYGEERTLTTKRLPGRYLQIQLNNRGILTLCEVEISAVAE